MSLIHQILSILIGFSSGAIIAAGVFAFISIIGIIPRMAQKTKTEKYVKIYEEVIVLGGISGCIASFFEPSILLPMLFTIFLSFLNGIFFGSLAVAVAETIDVIPILTRRVRINQGLIFFILSLALGKLVGSLLYFIMPGFFKNF